jgi:hypothetical protein
MEPRNHPWSKGIRAQAPEDWRDLRMIEDEDRRLLIEVLGEHAPIISERCSACHVPLHRGRELHWRRGMGGELFRMFLLHRCRERPRPE